MNGTTLRNRYRLDAELGRGDTGVVYLAHDTLLRRDVAIKVMSVSGLGHAIVHRALERQRR